MGFVIQTVLMGPSNGIIKAVQLLGGLIEKYTAPRNIHFKQLKEEFSKNILW